MRCVKALQLSAKMSVVSPAAEHGCCAACALLHGEQCCPECLLIGLARHAVLAWPPCCMWQAGIGTLHGVRFSRVRCLCSSLGRMPRSASISAWNARGGIKHGRKH